MVESFVGKKFAKSMFEMNGEEKNEKIYKTRWEISLVESNRKN